MLTPTRFLDACRRRCGDYFTLRPTPDREVVVHRRPGGRQEGLHGRSEPALRRRGQRRLGADARPRLGAAARRRRAPAPPQAAAAAVPRRADARLRRDDGGGRRTAHRRMAAWRAASPVLPSMQAITLEIIMRAVFGFDDRERRERIGDPLRRLLDTVGSRPRVLAMALTAGRNGPLSPWRRFAAIRAEARRAALRGDPRPPGRSRTAPTATTSSRCCWRPAIPTGAADRRRSCATS